MRSAVSSGPARPSISAMTCPACDRIAVGDSESSAPPPDRAAGTPRAPRRARRRCTAAWRGGCRVPRRVGRDRGFGGDVAPAEILGERAPHDLAIERRARAARRAATSRRPPRPVAAALSSGGASSICIGPIGPISTSNCRIRHEPVTSGAISLSVRATSSGTLQRNSDTGVFRARDCADFCLRTSPSTSIAERERLVAFGVERAADRLEHLRRASATSARWIDPALPPRPHFLGRIRHVRREQPQQHAERGLQRGIGGRRRPRRPDRRSAATSPARDSCRRSPRRTLSTRCSALPYS